MGPCAFSWAQYEAIPIRILYNILHNWFYQNMQKIDNLLIKIKTIFDEGIDLMKMTLKHYIVRVL
jgi:hypothetical protein